MLSDPGNQRQRRIARRARVALACIVAGVAALIVSGHRATSAAAAPAPAARGAAHDSADVALTVARFHDALARGDSSAALAMLAPDVVILESGGLESLADYRSHHLPSDIEYARAVPGTRTVDRVTISGRTAWLVATSRSSGTFRGKEVSSSGAELVVLRRAGAGWRISAIHWSSRRRAT